MKLLNLSADKSQENAVISGGRSMVEMLGVLAIIGVLSVGAIAGYQKAMEKYRWNIFVRDVNTLIFNTKAAIGTKYVERENFSFLLENMKDLPGGFYRGEHPTVGLLKYTPDPGFGYATPDVFNGSRTSLTFWNTSTEFCRKVLQTDWQDLNWNAQGGGIMILLPSGIFKSFKKQPTIGEIDVVCSTPDKVLRVVLVY